MLTFFCFFFTRRFGHKGNISCPFHLVSLHLELILLLMLQEYAILVGRQTGSTGAYSIKRCRGLTTIGWQSGGALSRSVLILRLIILC